MTKLFTISVFLLRVALGWLFLYAGITKVLNPAWSAAGYIQGSTTFPELYAFFLEPSVLPYINFLNSWGQVVIGASLIIGLWVRWSSLGGLVMMLLYYFPVLKFPYVGEHGFIVDEHMIYALVFLLFISLNAGAYWGLDRRAWRS